jgi:fimbrial chaperone protein
LLIAVFRSFLFPLLVFLMDAACPAIAGSFSIDPVRIALSEAKPSAVMRVENRADAAITVQLQVMSWSQSGNRDELAISRELLATPQVFRLRPGQVQVVRIALLRPVDDNRELAYRLLLDEVPPAPAADFRGLQVALRLSMPVFVQPRAAAAAALSAAVIERDGQRQLQLTNRGQAHLQLTDLTLQAMQSPGSGSLLHAGLPPEPSAPTLYLHDKAVYVLPGQQRELPMPAAAALPNGASLLLRAQTPGGAQQWSLPATGH